MSDIEQIIERRSREQIERTRALLRFEGRPDLVAELDANLRDIRLGITGARGTWHALSDPQRKALKAAADRRLIRLWGNRAVWGFRRPSGGAKEVCQYRTLTPLFARGLMEAADDRMPASAAQITERGQFVLKHGPKSRG